MTEHSAQHRNEILLVGRITSPPAERALPSGDVVHSWRVTMDRGDGGHDVVTCSAWTARLQRTAASWQKGDVVEVAGAVRSRFWRSGAGLGSALEVEVRRARRVASAATRPRTRE